MITVDITKTGENIENMRRSSGLTVRQVLDEIGLSSPNSFSKWIHGQSIPTVDNLVALADIFGCEIGDIVATQTIAV